MSWNEIPTQAEARAVFGDDAITEPHDDSEDYGLPLVDIGRGVKACAATITPELASKMLNNRHDRNRKTSPVKTRKYGEDMARDAWPLNGETVIFDRTGRLQNGHHRLEGCVKADTPFTTVVVRVPDENAIYTIDQVRTRSVNQALKMVDGAIADSATLGLIWNHLLGTKLVSASQEPITPAEALEFQKELPNLQKSIDMGKAVQKRVKGPYAAYAALHFLGSQTKYNADYFFEHLASGTELPEGSPILALREWLIKARDDKDGSRVLRAHVPWQYIIRAWNSWTKEESISYMKNSVVWHEMRGLLPEWRFGARKAN